MISLSGKTAIVTGGARGIGKATCLKLASLGANIVVADMNPEATNATAEELKSKGYKAIAVVANVSVEEDAQKLIDSAKKEFGTVDILVNNAGITRDTLLMRMKKEAVGCCDCSKPYWNLPLYTSSHQSDDETRKRWIDHQSFLYLW